MQNHSNLDLDIDNIHQKEFKKLNVPINAIIQLNF